MIGHLDVAAILQSRTGVSRTIAKVRGAISEIIFVNACALDAADACVHQSRVNRRAVIAEVLSSRGDAGMYAL